MIVWGSVLEYTVRSFVFNSWNWVQKLAFVISAIMILGFWKFVTWIGPRENGEGNEDAAPDAK
jgi:hypothetical protein